MGLKRFFSKLLSSPTQKRANLSALRTLFQIHYHHFRMLILANRRSLQYMSELEEELKAPIPSVVQEKIVRMGIEVQKMVIHLNALSPGKYQVLLKRFDASSHKIHRKIKTLPHNHNSSNVIFLNDLDRSLAGLAGNKISVLGEIRKNLFVKVPYGFVITTKACNEFLKYNNVFEKINNLYLNYLSSSKYSSELYQYCLKVQQIIIESKIPENITIAIVDAYNLLRTSDNPNPQLAVRSSATGEDSLQTSFAGLFRSCLNIAGQDKLFTAFKEVVASKYSFPAVQYRVHFNIPDERQQMAVGCLVMSSAICGGVAYTQNPINSHRKGLYISSNWGLPVSVVNGTVPTDTFLVSRERPGSVLNQEIANKAQPPKGHWGQEGSVQNAGPSLTPEQLETLSLTALRLEQYFQVPVDIEWLFEPDGDLTILQCRPLFRSRKAAALQTTSSSTLPEPVLQDGITASPGLGTGPVHIVDNETSALEFPEGGVVVAQYALPRWAPLLDRASAIVSEQGNIAGHLASVAREFGIPALFGVEKATQFLSPGQEITVDANQSRVYSGKIEFSSTSDPSQLIKKERASAIALPPILQGLSEQILPLHLTDPDAGTFRAQNCQTWHDMTRFCHEKAIHEIFSFGLKQSISGQASKQLITGEENPTPMQFWVINLDDGFRKPIKGPYVHISNICSNPMLPLWIGMIDIPWSGPPPVDAKGFCSILLESTINPNLNPAVQSDFQNKNYFIISKSFCSLHSRFGFHFSIVEAMLGDEHQENYICFQFKGGAANQARRITRTKLIGEILENFNFSIRQRDDTLFARSDNFPDKEIVKRLLIVGYLVIHTRQLDMVMHNNNSLNEQHNRLTSDIEKLLAKWQDLDYEEKIYI